MKLTALLAALAALLIANQSANAQGALTPPGAPAESQKSLQEIYDAIQSAKSEFATLVQQAVPSVPGMVAVLGGTLPETSELAGETVSTFYIGKYEVTWAEWQEVRNWAIENGYEDLVNVGAGSADNHPVRNVDWHAAVKWINAKSEREGLTPVYIVDGVVYKIGNSEPSVRNNSNGYRLPTETEWEWAARGGVRSQGFTYSGSDDVNDVAWDFLNSIGSFVDLYEGRGTWPVGSKMANELGIFDMSGNVFEWTWDYYADYGRRNRGGGYFTGPESSALNNRNNYGPYDTYLPVHGFRLARSY